MQGNLHARFLGEGGAAMRHPHPTCGRDTNAAKARVSRSSRIRGFFVFSPPASLRHNLEFEEQQACPTISINGVLTRARCARARFAPTRANTPSRSFSPPATCSRTPPRRRPVSPARAGQHLLPLHQPDRARVSRNAWRRWKAASPASPRLRHGGDPADLHGAAQERRSHRLVERHLRQHHGLCSTST